MTDALEALRGEARPLEGGPRDFDALLESIGNSRFVLLGEASHGTHEFYRTRSLAEQFDAVIHCDVTRAVEPLERLAPVPAGELPETYPWGV